MSRKPARLGSLFPSGEFIRSSLNVRLDSEQNQRGRIESNAGTVYNFDSLQGGLQPNPSFAGSKKTSWLILTEISIVPFYFATAVRL